MGDTWTHIPVLLEEVIAALRVRPGGRYVDATVNGGGHAGAILSRAPDTTVLGIERDPSILAALRARRQAEIDSGRLRVAAGDFRDLAQILAAHDFLALDGIMFDLGVSSFHLDAAGRGFSFRSDEPLDMRFDPEASAGTASEILATHDAASLTQLFRSYGEERFASRIARTIVARRGERPLRTSRQLLDLISLALPAQTRWRAERHAARIFQALRIAVNDELGALSEALPAALAALVPGGRLTVIAFHSLEDRLVKHFFRDQQQRNGLSIVSRKPIVPTAEEIAANPRAASAKLRVAERTSEGLRT